MKRGYWVNVYRAIKDEEALKAYAALAGPAVEAFGGRFLTRGASNIETREAGLPLRTVIVEFDSFEIALQARESVAYQQALKVLGTAAERDVRIVEGVETSGY